MARISEMILCSHCRAGFVVNEAGELVECPKCGGTGISPESFEGCDEHDEDE